MSRFLVLSAMILTTGVLPGADRLEGMKKGTPTIKSISSMAFGPDGILFIGDPQSASIFAIATGDTKLVAKGEMNVPELEGKIAELLGANKASITINDVRVNPASGVVYVAVTKTGTNGGSIILKVARDGSLSEMSTVDVKYSSVELTNAAKERQRRESITSIAYVEGKVVVAGLSNEEFASTLRVIPFPFNIVDKGASIEIFHGAHGKFETHSPVRTFTPYTVNGSEYLLAAYTCTPLVRIPMTELKSGAQVKGTTVAELGNRNRPLDMFTYTKNGKDYILMANSARGVMKIHTAGIEKAAAIVKKVNGGASAGIPYETVKTLSGVVQLDKLDEKNALVLITDGRNGYTLKSVPLP